MNTIFKQLLILFIICFSALSARAQVRKGNLDNLRELKAIKLDWGRNAGDRFTIQCEMFSQRLENVGITHFAEEYIGTHGSGIYTKDGRVPNQMLPFFNFYLDFEEE